MFDRPSDTVRVILDDWDFIQRMAMNGWHVIWTCGRRLFVKAGDPRAYDLDEPADYAEIEKHRKEYTTP